MVLYYFYDPMCSWCYAFDLTYQKLESALPDSICSRKIVGGLAPDSTVIMPLSMICTIQSAWQQIERAVPHIQFNYEFWSKNNPMRSTYPACRAVLAAKKQSPKFENKMIHQIQWAYYKNAENPSLSATLLNCAKKINLNYELFENDIASQEIEMQLQYEIQFTRRAGVSTYPSLCLQMEKKLVPIKIDYNDAQKIIEQIQLYINLPINKAQDKL
ncbi:MAG: DsbA family protein [Methylococcaceae bacterium]|nr:DsbA family protein [Methylococcaceae bacterium]